MKGFEKWNRHQVGVDKWLSEHRDNSHRDAYVRRVLDSGFKKVLEIGPGEATEAIEIVKKNPDICYVVADVSESFLKHCSDSGLETVEASMTELPFDDNEFDLIRLCCVIEHSPNIRKTIKEMARVAKNFHLTLFKWRNRGNEEMLSRYKPSKKYYSTTFNLEVMKAEIEKYGSIREELVALRGDSMMSVQEFGVMVAVDEDLSSKKKIRYDLFGQEAFRNKDVRLILTGSFE